LSTGGGFQATFLQERSFVAEEESAPLGFKDMLSAIAICTNSILGAGTMAEPVAACKCSMVVYFVVIAFMMASSFFTVKWLVAVADALPEGMPRNYEGIARHFLGPCAAALISGVFVFGGFSLGMAYMLLISKSLAPIIADHVSLSEEVVGRIVLWSVGLGLVLPLALLRDISRLKFTSSLAVTSLTYAACFIVFGGIADLRTKGPADDVQWFSWSIAVFQAMGMMVSDFSCHISTMPIYASLGPQRSQRFMMVVVTTSLYIAACVYQLVGGISYVRFGSEVLQSGNILNTLAEQDPESIPMMFANIGVSISLMFTMPIAMWPLRSVVLTAARTRRGADLAADPTCTEWTIATCCLITAVLTLATLVPDIKVIMSIGGSVGGTFIVFIFPSAFYLAVVKKVQPGQWFRLENAAQISFIVLGIAFGVLCFSSSVQSAIVSFTASTTNSTTPSTKVFA